jgi:hypothetical protein
MRDTCCALLSMANIVWPDVVVLPRTFWSLSTFSTARSVSRCPDPDCCRNPPGKLAERWAGQAWPTARAASSQFAAMPLGSFPGVDETEVYEFLQRHSAQ